MKKVYYTHYIGDGTDKQFPIDWVESPRKYRNGYSMDYDHSKCPAWKKWTENCWEVTQPVSIGFSVSRKERRIETDLSQKAYDDYFHVGENWLKGEYPEIQMQYVMCLWTEEKDVWVEQIPHPQLSRYGLELIPGTFPISVWSRPMVVGVKVLDDEANIMLRRGLPLYYFRLYSMKSDDTYQLEEKDPPEKWHKEHKQQNILREFAPFKAWEIITQRLSREEKKSRCPLRWN